MDPPGTIMHVNGKRAIGIGISTDPQKDVVKTGELVDKRLAELLPRELFLILREQIKRET